MRRLDRRLAARGTGIDVESDETVRVFTIPECRPRRFLDDVNRCLAPERRLERPDAGQHAASGLWEEQGVRRCCGPTPADDDVHSALAGVDDPAVGFDRYWHSGFAVHRSPQRMRAFIVMLVTAYHQVNLVAVEQCQPFLADTQVGAVGV